MKQFQCNCGLEFDTAEDFFNHLNTGNVQKFAQLEERIKSLEADRDRFMNAFKEAAGAAIKNPMVAAMIPKEMKEGIKRFTEQGN